MITSYIAKTTINFVDFEFYIRPGDLLVHDTANHNRLTIYRNGQIAKVGKLGSLGVFAFIKNKFIEEVTVAAVSPVEVKVVPSPLTPPTLSTERKTTTIKRDRVSPPADIIEEDKVE